MSLTHAVGWALVHFVWQGAVVGAAAWLVLSVTRRAATRYAVAAAALGMAALLFVATTVAARGRDVGVVVPAATGAEPVPGTAAPARGARPGSVTPPVPAPVGEPRSAAGPPATVAGRPPFVPVGSPLHRAVEPRLPLLVALWLAGVLVLAVRLLGGWAAARRLVREGTRPVADAWREAAARLAGRVGVRRAVRVLESAVAAVPAVVGWLSPVILVPASAFTGLTPRQLEVLIAHELAHVRRHDYLVNLFQCAIETLLFYHPAVWWLSSRLREEREHCCDDIAVAVTGNARDYAEALLDLERLRLRSPGLAMAATGGSLLERVRRLVAPGDARGETFPRWSAGVLVVMLVAMGAVVPWLAAAPATEALPIFARAPRPTSTAAGVEASTPGGPPEPQKPGQRRDSTRWNPDTVIRHADPSRPLDERLAWARAEATRRGDRAYWVGYTVRPLAWARGAIYSGSGASFFTEDGSTFISGTLFNVGDPSRIRMSGVPLLPLLGGRADDAAILLEYDRTGGRPALVSANVVTLALSFEFDRRPLFWLGSADDAQSIPMLRGLFDAGGAEELRNALVRAIGIHRTSELVAPVLMPIVESRSPDGLRAEAAEWLGRHPHRGGLRLLARTARGDRSANVRAEAAEAVGDMSLPEAFDTLVALARTLADVRARQEAVEALGGRDEPGAVAVLAEVARDDRDPGVQREAAETLGDFEDGRGARALEQLARTHLRPDVRQEAVETLAYTAPPAEAAALLERIVRTDPNQGVRHEAIESLAEVRDGRGLPVLRELAREHPDRDVRQQAVEHLGPHLPTEEAFTFLREVAERDASPDVQREAVETLGDLHDDRAVPILADIANRHPSVEVAREAVETLGAFPTPAAAAALERLAREHRAWQVQVEAVETLGEGHDHDPAALRQVAAIATDHPDKRVRIEAIETYGEHAPGEAVAALLGRIIDRETDLAVLVKAIETLGEHRDSVGLAQLGNIALFHQREQARFEAIETLGEHASPQQALAVIARLIERDRDEAVLHEALETAMDLEGGAGIALVIRVAERHENPRVRALAIQELRDSDDPRARAALARLRRSPER